MTSPTGSGPRPSGGLQQAVLALSDEVFDAAQRLLKAQHELIRALMGTGVAAEAEEQTGQEDRAEEFAPSANAGDGRESIAEEADRDEGPAAGAALDEQAVSKPALAVATELDRASTTEPTLAATGELTGPAATEPTLAATGAVATEPTDGVDSEPTSAADTDDVDSEPTGAADTADTGAADIEPAGAVATEPAGTTDTEPTDGVDSEPPGAVEPDDEADRAEPSQVDDQAGRRAADNGEPAAESAG